MSEGFVYLIQSESGHYKIGKTTKSPESRIQSFKTGCPFPIYLIHKIQCVDCSLAEKSFHLHFKPKRVHGEWFTLDCLDVEWICRFDLIEATNETGLYLIQERIGIDGQADMICAWVDSINPLWGDL